MSILLPLAGGAPGTSRVQRDFSHGDLAHNAISNDARAWRRAQYHKRGAIRPYWTTFTLKNEKAVPKPTQVPVRLPWEVMHVLWRYDKSAFNRCFVGPGGRASVEEYWQCAGTQEWGKRHPVVAEWPRALWQVTLGFRWHLDGVKVFKSSGDPIELVLCSWRITFSWAGLFN